MIDIEMNHPAHDIKDSPLCDTTWKSEHREVIHCFNMMI